MRKGSQQKLILAIIKGLRRRRLSEEKSFMINSNSLPSHQCYLEFSDGSIAIAEANPSKTDFRIIKQLNDFEIRKLRKMFNLYK
ncbi:hypothetical protein [Parafilimonas sp.]|uniref:hypothetical protein n=1 Tax=Parafilimonas sp. TaxID=1969739 RepID=UPI0039E217F0